MCNCNKKRQSLITGNTPEIKQDSKENEVKEGNGLANDMQPLNNNLSIKSIPPGGMRSTYVRNYFRR
jgi:hypothetical protein